MSLKHFGIRKRFNIYALLFLLNIIELTTYGSIMLLVDSEIEEDLLCKLKSLSTTFYLLSTVTAQFFFNLFSQIPLVAGPISEASVMINEIMTYAYLKDKNTFVINGLVGIFLSTLLYSFFSSLFIPLSRILRRVPLSVSHGIMVGTGIMQFQVPLILFKQTKLTYISLCLVVLLIFFLERRFCLNHLCLFISFVVSLSFFPFKKDNWYTKPVDFIDGLKLFTGHSLKDLRVDVLIQLIPKIISISFFCLLQLPANLLAYESFTKKQYKFSKELRTQGITNLICSICIFPVYFICPYSSILFENKLTSVDAFILTLVFLFIFPILNLVLKIVPLFVQSFFPLLIGYTMCHEYTLDAFTSSYLDLFITSVVALTSLKLPMVGSFLIGLTLAFIFKMYMVYLYGKTIISIEEKDGITFIKLYKYCLFDKIYKIEQFYHKKIIIELCEFKYYDLNCKNALYRLNERNRVVFCISDSVLQNDKNFLNFEVVSDVNEGINKLNKSE